MRNQTSHQPLHSMRKNLLEGDLVGLVVAFANDSCLKENPSPRPTASPDPLVAFEPFSYVVVVTIAVGLGSAREVALSFEVGKQTKASHYTRIHSVGSSVG